MLFASFGFCCVQLIGLLYFEITKAKPKDIKNKKNKKKKKEKKGVTDYKGCIFSNMAALAKMVVTWCDTIISADWRYQKSVYTIFTLQKFGCFCSTFS